jgi:hypothetical protein
MASLSNLVYCLWARAGAYPRVEHLKGFHLGRLLNTLKRYTILERLAMDKHSSLLRKFVTYDCKKFYKICPRFQQQQNFVAAL